MSDTFDPVMWPRYEEYVFREVDILEQLSGRERCLCATGEVISTLDLSNEDQQYQMFEDLVNMKTEDELLEFANLYGLPSKYRHGKDDEPLPRVNVKEELKVSNQMYSVWQLYQHASKRQISKLENLISVWYAVENLYDRETLWLMDSRSDPILARLDDKSWEAGARNLKVLSQSVNPFLQESLQFKTAGLRINEETLVGFAGDKPRRNLYSQDALEVPLSHWLSNYQETLIDVAYRLVVKYVQLPRRALVIEKDKNGDVQLIPKLQAKDPVEAAANVLFKEVTQANLMEPCPNPRCGRLFLVTRTTKSSCRREVCKKYVTEHGLAKKTTVADKTKSKKKGGK